MHIFKILDSTGKGTFLWAGIYFCYGMREGGGGTYFIHLENLVYLSIFFKIHATSTTLNIQCAPHFVPISNVFID